MHFTHKYLSYGTVYTMCIIHSEIVIAFQATFCDHKNWYEVVTQYCIVFRENICV